MFIKTIAKEYSQEYNQEDHNECFHLTLGSTRHICFLTSFGCMSDRPQADLEQYQLELHAIYCVDNNNNDNINAFQLVRS